MSLHGGHRTLARRPGSRPEHPHRPMAPRPPKKRCKNNTAVSDLLALKAFFSELGDTVYRPLYEVASSRLARKTHVDMLNKVQINYYAAGLHREGSKAVFRYTSLELADRFALLNAAFGEEGYKVEGL